MQISPATSNIDSLSLKFGLYLPECYLTEIIKSNEAESIGNKEGKFYALLVTIGQERTQSSQPPLNPARRKPVTM